MDASDRSCKTTELKSLCGAKWLTTDFESALGISKGLRSAGTLLRCCETGFLYLSFWVVAVTSSIHTEFSLPPCKSKQNTAVWGREFLAWGWWGDPRGLCHARETSCSWLKPLWWLPSAPPALVGIIADPQEVGEKPTQVGFVCTALLFELCLGILLWHSLPVVSLLLPMGILSSLFLFLHLGSF